MVEISESEQKESCIGLCTSVWCLSVMIFFFRMMEQRNKRSHKISSCCLLRQIFSLSLSLDFFLYDATGYANQI